MSARIQSKLHPKFLYNVTCYRGHEHRTGVEGPDPQLLRVASSGSPYHAVPGTKLVPTVFSLCLFNFLNYFLLVLHHWCPQCLVCVCPTFLFFTCAASLVPTVFSLCLSNFFFSLLLHHDAALGTELVPTVFSLCLSNFIFFTVVASFFVMFLQRM